MAKINCLYRGILGSCKLKKLFSVGGFECHVEWRSSECSHQEADPKTTEEEKKETKRIEKLKKKIKSIKQYGIELHG